MLWWGPFFSLRGPCGFCFASDHWRHDVLYFYPTDFSVSFFFCPLKSFKWMKIHGNILFFFVFFKKALDLWLSTISELLFFFKIHLGQGR
jgi:hypothetical protein